MERIEIQSADDPRIRPYRDLRDRQLARDEGLFLAEGVLLVRQLMESAMRCHSVLLSEGRAAAIRLDVPAGVPVYVAPDELLAEIAGFDFHRGVMACGERPPSPPLEAVLTAPEGRMTVAVCPSITNAENLGSVVRLCDAFGVDALVAGPGGCDPFARRVVRVSMGGVLRLPIVRPAELGECLQELRDRWGFEIAAAVCDATAEPVEHAARRDRLALLFGGEGQGLDDRWIASADRTVTIPLAPKRDSLNVAVAAGILLHHFMRIA